MDMVRIRDDVRRWKSANPWVLLNLQNSSALSGRYPSKELAIEAAELRGGCLGIEGNTVLFSEMPVL